MNKVDDIPAASFEEEPEDPNETDRWEDEKRRDSEDPDETDEWEGEKRDEDS